MRRIGAAVAVVAGLASASGARAGEGLQPNERPIANAAYLLKFLYLTATSSPNCPAAAAIATKMGSSTGQASTLLSRHWNKTSSSYPQPIKIGSPLGATTCGRARYAEALLTILALSLEPFAQL